MSDHPTLPITDDGLLPPAMLLLRWLASNDVQDLILPTAPYSNGSLPDLCRLAGIQRLWLKNPGRLPLPLRWEGDGGARLTLLAQGAPCTRPERLHHGRLPVDLPDDCLPRHGLSGLTDLARLEDAAALLSQGRGAAWDHILAVVGQSHPPAPPPLTRNPRQGRLDGASIWNPLPFPRQCLTALPHNDGRPPWGLRDSRGRRHSVQVVEGPLGSQLLTSLPLGALEAVSIETWDDPVPSGYWEVNERTLDNGIIRAELDDMGQITRLACKGHYVDIAAPLCQPRIEDIPFPGAAHIQVIEGGPIRARITVSRESAIGLFHCTYTLHVHEELLHIQSTWSGHEHSRLHIDLPTSYRRRPLQCASDWAPWEAAQAATATSYPMPLQRSLRWALLREAESGRGIGIASPRPMDLNARAGHLRLHIGHDALHIALLGNGEAPGCDQPQAAQLCRCAQHLACGGRYSPSIEASQALLTWQERPDLVPLWIRPVDSEELELTLIEASGKRSSTWLRLPGPNARLCDLAGNTLRQLPSSKEGDAVLVPSQPYEILLIRCKR